MIGNDLKSFDVMYISTYSIIYSQLIWIQKAAELNPAPGRFCQEGRHYKLIPIMRWPLKS